ncbi:hypothetical protein EDD85DRAFT_1008361 [Armillaria nabsnona]|nr:hypothetical protein EDD85DRAFT_1008361 [Armillaria nabsnona]
MTSSHILSTISARLERDTFIFSTTAPTRLVLGLNQRLTPVSSATLHRWVRLIIPTPKPFTLHPVTVRQFGIMSYAIELNGEDIPADSTEALPIGNYAWYWSDGDRAYPEITAFTRLAPFPEMKAHNDPDTLFDVVHLVAEAVRQRSPPVLRYWNRILGRRRTGMSIPAILLLSSSYEDPPPSGPEFFKTVSNAGFMHKRLMPFYLGNAFRIDVDDDHRVVVFRDMGSTQLLLPSHIFTRDGQEPDDKFLREHFCVSLQVNLLGGDVCEDYNHNDILSMMEELGVEGEDYVQPLPLTDPRWQTVLGKAIFEDVLLSKITLACLDDLDSD